MRQYVHIHIQSGYKKLGKNSFLCIFFLSLEYIGADLIILQHITGKILTFSFYVSTFYRSKLEKKLHLYTLFRKILEKSLKQKVFFLF